VCIADLLHVKNLYTLPLSLIYYKTGASYILRITVNWYNKILLTPTRGLEISRLTNRNGRPNAVVEWLALLLRIRVVPSSNFGMETGYTD
jgi:hypothetical protein